MSPAKDDTPHGLTPSQIEALGGKGEQMLGSVWSPKTAHRNLIEELLPEGMGLAHRRGQVTSTTQPMNTGSGSSLFTTMRPYQPEFEPDRQMFPIHRRLANSYWRLFYKMDPVIGAVIDMICELVWGEFQLTGEGVDGEVKETLEYMITETKLKAILPMLVREFLVIGEAIPHLFYDNEKGVWTHIALHNPDQINVVYSPFIKMDTIMEFVPDPKLREIVTSTHPMLARVRETMPSELISHLQSGENIPLSPVNSSFIARKLHYYDLRGTSIISRLWRTLMLEDAIWAATIATARRSAAPIKVAKLGDPATGTIPSPAEEKRVLQLLAQAEVDPQAWLCYNYQIQFELAGAPERIMSINQHYDLIERIKLSALGVSKSFLAGEVSYSSAAAGLTVFLQRLKAMRDYFVNEWLIPKFFLPVAQMNKWIKPSKASAGGGQVQIKRSSRELIEENMYIIPTIEWEKSLDPSVDNERIDAMTALENNLRIKISDSKKFSSAGLDPEEEWKTIIEETKTKQRLAGEDPMLQVALGLVAPADPGAGGGGGGAMLSPGIPPEAMGMPPTGDDTGGGAPPPDAGGGAPPPMPEGASLSADQGAQPAPAESDVGSTELQHWPKQALDPLLKLFEEFDATVIEDEEPWLFALKDPDVKSAISSKDPTELWLAIEQFLIDEDYPGTALVELRDTLRARGKLPKRAEISSESLEALASQLGVSVDDTDVNTLVSAG